jgi:hypothetical protein
LPTGSAGRPLHLTEHVVEVHHLAGPVRPHRAQGDIEQLVERTAGGIREVADRDARPRSGQIGPDLAVRSTELGDRSRTTGVVERVQKGPSGRS